MRFTADFDTLIERFSPRPENPIALAVSGGSDSLAMLLLADEWAKRLGRKLLVLTVDHRLRPEAVGEAEQVARTCKSLGHSHETLIWQTPRTSQNAARQARYELLAGAAKAHGAHCILTGHTFDDVVETAIIRRRHGVRDARVAGPTMAAPVPVWPEGRDTALLRPLIRTRRDDLRIFLRSRGEDWVEDPSNQKSQYERVRVRQFLKRHSKLAAIAGEFVERAQVERSASEVELATELAKIQVDVSGLINTGTARLTSELMILLARCASGSSTDPRGGAARQMLKDLAAPGSRQTLGGAWFQRTNEGMIVGRDPAPVSNPAHTDLFDGRYVRDEVATLPTGEDMAFLVRQSAPPDLHWREIVSDRLAHLALCYQTPLLNPVQT